MLKPMDWEVTSDPHRVGEVCRRGTREAWTAERILDRIAEESVERSLAIQLLSPMAEHWIPRLKQIAADVAHPNRWRMVRAGWYLLFLGDTSGTQPFVEFLRSADPEDRWNGVLSLCSADQDLPYDRDILATALRPELNSDDDHVRTLVAQIYWRHRLPGWADVLQAQVGDPSMKVRLGAIHWLALEGGSEPCLKLVESMLTSGEGPTYNLVQALSSMAAAAASPVKLQASQTLIKYVRGHLAEITSEVANNLMNACRALQAGRHPDAGKILREVIASKQLGWYREVALRELTRLEGRAALGDLDRALSDEETARVAAAEIGYLGRNSGDPDLVRLLARVIGSSKHADIMVRALSFIGGVQARAIVREFLPSTLWWNRLEAEWCLRSLSHREALYRLIALGVLSRWPESAMAAGLLEPDSQGNPPGAQTIVIRAFQSAGRFLSFDLEVCKVPVDHDLLIWEFSEISGGIFNPDAVVQTWKNHEEEPEPSYTVEFVYRGRLHRFAAQFRGDYYDAEAVVTALNRALRLVGRPERFVRLFAGYDQHVEYVFANAQALLAARRELLLPLHLEFDIVGMTDEHIEDRLSKELELE